MRVSGRIPCQVLERGLGIFGGDICRNHSNATSFFWGGWMKQFMISANCTDQFREISLRKYKIHTLFHWMTLFSDKKQLMHPYPERIGVIE